MFRLLKYNHHQAVYQKYDKGGTQPDDV